MKQKKQLSELRKFKRPAATIFADRTAYAYFSFKRIGNAYILNCVALFLLSISRRKTLEVGGKDLLSDYEPKVMALSRGIFTWVTNQLNPPVRPAMVQGEKPLSRGERAHFGR